MELTINNQSSRILLERVDNGVILYDIGDDNTVISKIVYEIYFKDGIIDFENMGIFLIDILETLKIPLFETETNTILTFGITKIDPSIPDEEDDSDDAQDEKE